MKASSESLFWILWGIAVSFGMQVVWYEVEIFPNLDQRFWGGIIIEFVLVVFLLVFGRRLQHRA